MGQEDVDLEAGSTRSAPKSTENEKHDRDTESAGTGVSTRPRTASVGLEEVDPSRKFTVDWEENDPLKPTNWTTRKKWKNLWIVSAITFITYVLRRFFGNMT